MSNKTLDTSIGSPNSSFIWIGKVKYDCPAVEKTELSVTKGEIVHVREENDTGWSLVKNKTGETGWVPRDFIKKIVDLEPLISPKDSFWLRNTKQGPKSASRPTSPTSPESPSWIQTSRTRANTTRSDEYSNNDIPGDYNDSNTKDNLDDEMESERTKTKTKKKYESMKRRRNKARRLSQSLTSVFRRSKSSGAKRGLKKSTTRSTLKYGKKVKPKAIKKGVSMPNLEDKKQYSKTLKGKRTKKKLLKSPTAKAKQTKESSKSQLKSPTAKAKQIKESSKSQLTSPRWV